MLPWIRKARIIWAVCNGVLAAEQTARRRPRCWIVEEPCHNKYSAASESLSLYPNVCSWRIRSLWIRNCNRDTWLEYFLYPVNSASPDNHRYFPLRESWTCRNHQMCTWSMFTKSSNIIHDIKENALLVSHRWERRIRDVVRKEETHKYLWNVILFTN